MALPTPGPEARDRVSRAQLTAFRAAVGPASVVSVVCALLAAWALEPLVGRGVLWPWLSLLLSVLALRALLTLRMGPAAEPTRAMRVLRGAAALHGLAWGSLVLWIGPLGGSTALTDTLVVVIGGVVLTALPLALIDGGAALAFVAPAVLPLAWRVLESPQPASRQVLLAGVLLLVLCGVMAGSARAARRGRLEVTAAQEAEQTQLEAARHAEQQVRRVFDHVAEGLCMFDTQWRLVAWNPRLLDLLGADPAQVHEGMTLEQLLRHLAARGEYGQVDADAEVQRRLHSLTDGRGAVAERSRRDGRMIETRRNPLPGGGFTLSCVDITQRRHSERALAEQRRMLSLLIENSEQGFWFIDNALRTTDANPAMCRMLRIEREALLGRTIYDFVDAENEAVFREQVRRRTEGRASSYEITLRRTDGTPVHCWNNATPVHDADGVKTGAIGLFSDISAHKEAAAALERTSRLLAEKTRVLEATFESLSQGVMSVGPDGRVEAWNQRLLELLELPESMLAAHPSLRELVNWQIARGDFDVDPAAPAAEWYQRALQFAGGDDTAVDRAYHHRRRRADGLVIEVQTHASAQGAHVRTYTDVTASVHAELALRESEARFRTMADSAPALIWQADAQGRTTWFNNAWLQSVGQTLEQALATSWRTRIAAEDYDRALETYTRAFSRQLPFEVEYRLLAADGKVRWVADSGRPRTDGRGRFDGYVCYGWDVTARKSAESALIAARDDAERANRAKSEFLSRMSHELRTPLNAVLGFAQLVEGDREEPPSPRQRERLQQILQGGRHLLSLINEVLDLARIESGTLTVQSTAVDPLQALQACLQLVRPMADERAIAIVVESSGTGPGCVRADPTRLRQVLLNLLSNAIKYNRPGGLVRLRAAAGPQSVRLEVIDTGPGLSTAQQQRLFQAFERLGADHSGVEGAGIGLALSKALVDLMGGRIGVDSQAGQGSCFWIELERAGEVQAAGSGEAAALPFPPAAAPAASPGPGSRLAAESDVLYIEDNEVNQLLMAGMLARRPALQLRQALTPEDGLALARAKTPDLVLLDIQLPGMSGYEVLQQLREAALTRTVPVVAVSANAMPQDIDRAREAGFDDYLTKPLNLADLLATVDRFLGAGRAGLP
jgi:PAS domain S-box-containing protein